MTTRATARWRFMVEKRYDPPRRRGRENFVLLPIIPARAATKTKSWKTDKDRRKKETALSDRVV